MLPLTPLTDATTDTTDRCYHWRLEPGATFTGAHLQHLLPWSKLWLLLLWDLGIWCDAWPCNETVAYWGNRQYIGVVSAVTVNPGEPYTKFPDWHAVRHGTKTWSYILNIQDGQLHCRRTSQVQHTQLSAACWYAAAVRIREHVASSGLGMARKTKEQVKEADAEFRTVLSALRNQFEEANAGGNVASPRQ